MNIDRITPDKIVYILPNAVRAGQRRTDLEAGTRVTIVSDGVDSDGDAYVRDGEGNHRYVLPEFLSEMAPGTPIREGDRFVAVNVETDGYVWRGYVDNRAEGVVTEVNGSTSRVRMDDGTSRTTFTANLRKIEPAAVATGAPQVGDTVIMDKRVEWCSADTRNKTGVVLSVGRAGSKPTLRVDFSADGGPGREEVYADNASVVSTPVQSTDVDEYFKPGNELEFTVEASDLDATSFSVGCKSGAIADFLPMIQKLDRSTKKLTIRATVEANSNSGRPQIRHSGVLISMSEAAEYFKDVTILKAAEPPKPDVTLTLTNEEAVVLRDILGQMYAGGPTTPIWRKLDAMSEVEPGPYQMTDRNDARLPSVRVNKSR